MKILITGGAGFIGSNLTDRLLLLGHKVMVIDNFITGNEDNLTPHDDLEIVKGSIYNADFVNESFHSFHPDIVVHAAASYKDPHAWKEDVTTNILGGINVINASKDCCVQRFIYFQTALCYGLKPMESPISLNHPVVSGGSSYAISKTAFEHYLEISGLNFLSFRLANIYGPRNLTGAIPIFYQKLTNDQVCNIMDSKRDYVFIDDLLDVVIKAINGIGKSGHYHVSSWKDYSILEIFNIIKSLLNKESEPVIHQPGNDDTPTISLDPSKTKTDFDWEVKTTIQGGLKKAIDWYIEKEILPATYTHLNIPSNHYPKNHK
jgi:UDP-glucose 4-epimerase